NLYKYITSTHNEYVLSKQLLKSGTSIGANIREACTPSRRNAPPRPASSRPGERTAGRRPHIAGAPAAASREGFHLLRCPAPIG
ncbi:MAG: four helix bundle protein, partial [Oscillospiraceae bacterium]|nr:four helix bundle protein [Oscillospiraceae bacterium]